MHGPLAHVQPIDAHPAGHFAAVPTQAVLADLLRLKLQHAHELARQVVDTQAGRLIR